MEVYYGRRKYEYNSYNRKTKSTGNIQTYREITAFMDGERLDEIAKAKEEGKRPYQKVLLAVGAGVITFAIACLFAMLLK